VKGPIGEDSGWLIDYADIKAAWTPLHAALDHQYLNEIKGLENPTSEHLAVWIWKRLDGNLPWLHRVVVHETMTSRCTYFGPAGS
jgi:6-pyruvoyltetrahydropterin/6-carboxytetrahydropterin synthase